MDEENIKKMNLNQNSQIERFDLNERVQHIVLLSTLIILSLTGLALKFYDSWFGTAMINLEGGIQARGIIHRISAVFLIILVIYHAYYVLATEKGHREFMQLKPSRKDVKDFFQVMKFNLKLSDHYPAFDRFTYIEKFQYAMVIGGSMSMIVTGFVLWFENQSMAILPKWIIDVTKVIHGYEGTLLFILLFLWHIYNVHLNPSVFPMDMSWLTGKISLKELKEKHPIEYERIVEELREKE
jgi:cytochrome b subunit of formate dehydrogenase